MKHIRLAGSALVGAAVLSAPSLAGEWDLGAAVGYEARVFTGDPAFPGQFQGAQSSLILEADVRWYSDDNAWQLVILPYARLDGQDDERTHADLREAFVRWSGDRWGVRAGLGKVFWGTTESRHLVDIVNQTDAVEDIDEEDKLGQPMIEIERQEDWGRITAFILPAFRERTFAGPGGRLRGPLPVDADAALYESDDEETHVDFALRYSHYFGDWDVGLSVFDGTSREPTFRTSADQTRLIPFYDQITQAGVDVQYTRDAWLWKLEAIVRDGHGDTFGAVVGGFEYTFFGVTDAGADLGVLVEYHHDGRSDDPTVAPPTTFDDDVFVGARFAFNDIADTSVLAGGIVDANDGSTSGLVEAERRIGVNWTLEVEARFTTNVDAANPLAAFDADDTVTVRAVRYF